MKHHHVTTNRPLVGLITFLTVVSSTNAAYIAKHTFSVKDVLGGFDGVTFGDENDGSGSSGIVCGVPPFTIDGHEYNSDKCPDKAPQPITDKDNSKLYPIDSEFAFDVVDCAGAAQKTRDYDYQEGFVGNILEGQNVIGLKVSNSATSVYKVAPPLGTWCQGMGANSVKCSTEHFSVMEHILTCHETIPYLFANANTGKQAIQAVSDSLSIDCADTELDNLLYVVENGKTIDEEYDPKAKPDYPGYIAPNDNTDALNNLAASDSYSITLKDDGKVLYRWGNLIKRPTDIRISAKIPLPEEWKGYSDFVVTKAYLVIDHLITNNPNDQLRAEDLENEGATGRKPDYLVKDDKWLSTKNCYEGDGDLIEGGGEDGVITADPIPAGTVFKQNLPLQGTGDNIPETPSEDLDLKLTNAWYTTIERDPFEWSYRKSDFVGLESDGLNDFEGYAFPLSDEEADNLGLELVSGPRWRLKSNKFGQDIPGLEIPKKECSMPPFQNDNIKYQVGERVNTYINLLDWDEEKGPSPLAKSKGWVNYEANDFIEVDDVTARFDKWSQDDRGL